MAKTILPIVEGDTEVGAIPVLIRRFINRKEVFTVHVVKPYRVSRQKIVKENELERAIQVGINDRDNVGAIMVILDADTDCPMEIGPDLLERCKESTHLPISVILVKSKLECWFLGAKESLRGVRGIKADAITPDNPEALGIGRLENNMESGSYYHKVDDAPAFAAKLDIDKAALNCPSFARFVRETERLIKVCQD